MHVHSPRFLMVLYCNKILTLCVAREYSYTYIVMNKQVALILEDM